MKYTFLLLTAFVVIGLSGCDALLEPEPEGQIGLEQVFRDRDGAISALNAAYVPLIADGGYNGTSLISLTENASDNGWGWRGGVEAVKHFILQPHNHWVRAVWQGHFNGIARSNLVIENLPQTNIDDASLKDAMTGQALFLRALYYFNLVRLFGDVPLHTQPAVTPEDAAIPRTPTTDIYAQIEEDLTKAAELLPLRYTSSGSGFEEGRATRGSAMALLAKVHLTQEEWTDAAAAALEVINSGVYDLHSDYADNFMGRQENGIESVFEAQFSSADQSTGSSLSGMLISQAIPGMGGAGREWVIPTNDTLNEPGMGASGHGIVQAYDDGDARKDVAMSTYGQPNQRPLVNKYFEGIGVREGDSSVNVPIIRYAEVLLIRAEALNEMGGGNADAARLINQIRARAGLEPLSDQITSSQSNLREAIWKERRLELSFEFDRFFDLNRTARLREIMRLQGVEINPSKISPHPMTDKEQYLYPIPQIELDTNPNTTQNPGY